jgi:hypothetical protein
VLRTSWLENMPSISFCSFFADLQDSEDRSNSLLSKGCKESVRKTYQIC